MLAKNFLSSPENLKFNKFHRRVTFKTVSVSNSKIPPTSSPVDVVFLKALSGGRLSAANIESARKVIRRKVRRLGSLQIHVYPCVSITSKPLSVRMGKGKGAVSSWVCPVSTGKILFAIHNVPIELAVEALHMAAKKLPIPARIIRFI